MKANLDGILSKLRKYKPDAIIDAISYVVKTGCQWSKLPYEFSKLEYSISSFPVSSERGWFGKLLRVPIEGRRAYWGQCPEPYECVIDRQGVCAALSLDCMKSNFGTPDFILIKGRRIVECTFSWMANYRRLTRNYVRLPKVGRHIFFIGSLFFVLRYLA